jgi:hypothetical protein
MVWAHRFLMPPGSKRPRDLDGEKRTAHGSTIVRPRVEMSMLMQIGDSKKRMALLMGAFSVIL